MGMLRLFLALCVIAGHADTTILRFNGINARYAVNFFFIISGFYMAMVLNEKYANTKAIFFYKSRILRLYPVYYMGLALMLLAEHKEILDFFYTLSFGSKIFYIFQNLFILGQDLSYLACSPNTVTACASPVSLTINPPAWSIAVELGFYLVAPFILKSPKKTFSFILIGGVYELCINYLHFPLIFFNAFRSIDSIVFNYYFYPSSFIFFGGGALAYQFSASEFAPHYWASLATIILLSFAQNFMPSSNLILIGRAVPALFRYTKNNRIDRIIGELSYPLYILHFPILLLVRPLLKSNPEYFSVISLGTWVALISIGFALLIYFLLEQPINRYRHSAGLFDGSLRPPNKASERLWAIMAAIYLFAPFVLVIYIYLVQHSVVYKDIVAPFNLTDSNWINGVGRSYAGYFVKNSPQNLKRYKVGDKVKFANDEVREILTIVPSEQYIKIYVSGSPLNGNLVGFSMRIEVLK